MIFTNYLLGALLAITGTQASPHEGLDKRVARLRVRDLATTSCVDFGTGSPSGYVSVGQLCVTIDSASITVNYPTLTNGNTYFASGTPAPNPIHLYVGTTAPTQRQPGQFPYNNDCTHTDTTAQCVVPLSEFGPISCGDTLYIAAAADVAGPAAGTSWGNIAGGTTYACPNPKSNCAKYWSFQTTCECPVVTTYAPVTCTSTTAGITVITSAPSPVSGVTTCNVPTTTTITVTGPPATCAACASPFFCGCYY